jgi:Zn-dependent M28 family amino/carboxypeptidase
VKFLLFFSGVAICSAFSSVRSEELTRISPEALVAALKLRDQAASDPTAYAFVADLTTQIGPRLAGGANDQRARDWVVARFKALGFDKVWTEPVTYPKWVRHSESAAIVAPYPQPLALLALGGSPATPKGGLRGDVVAFKDFTALKAATPESVKGKIVYISYHMHAERDGHDYGPATAGRTRGPALAATLGASAFVLRSAGTDNNRLAHTGITDFGAGRKIPAAALSNPDADLLERMLAEGKPVTLKLDLDCGIEGQYTGANVIGQINGSGHPEQLIAIGGHLDSWDPGTGAIDDGAGVAIAAGAAHLISTLPQRPKRSIRVIAFANEEAGMFGGQAYAAAHKGDVAKHVLSAESDFGAAPIWRMSSQVKPEALGAIDQMMQVLSPLGVERGSNGGAEGGDFGSMGTAGMALLGLTQDGTRYFDWHHSANDTLDKIDAKELNQNVAVYAVFAYLAAQADGDFGSAPGAFPHAKED